MTLKLVEGLAFLLCLTVETKMKTNEIDESLLVACQVGVIPDEERERWMQVVRDVYSSVEEVLELEDGYSFRVKPHQLGLLGEHVTRDRLCCAFVRWEIVVEQANGPVWLRIRGPRGTKEFVTAAIGETDLLPVEVARAAGFSVNQRPVITQDSVEHFAEEVSGGGKAG